MNYLGIGNKWNKNLNKHNKRMKKVFIPEFVTKGYPKPKPMPTTGTWSGYPVKDADDNLDKPHFLPMVKEVYPSYFDAALDPEVSLPVLMKKYQKSLKKI